MDDLHEGVGQDAAVVARRGGRRRTLRVVPLPTPDPVILPPRLVTGTNIQNGTILKKMKQTIHCILFIFYFISEPIPLHITVLPLVSIIYDEKIRQHYKNNYTLSSIKFIEVEICDMVG